MAISVMGGAKSAHLALLLTKSQINLSVHNILDGTDNKLKKHHTVVPPVVFLFYTLHGMTSSFFDNNTTHVFSTRQIYDWSVLVC
jgi:hypothetical protein